MNEDANGGSGVLGAAVGLAASIGAPIAIHKGMTSDAMINYMDEQYMSKSPNLAAKAGAFYNDFVASNVRAPLAMAQTIDEVSGVTAGGIPYMKDLGPTEAVQKNVGTTKAEQMSIIADKLKEARIAYRKGDTEYKAVYKNAAEDLNKAFGGNRGKGIEKYISKIFKL